MLTTAFLTSESSKAPPLGTAPFYSGRRHFKHSPNLYRSSAEDTVAPIGRVSGRLNREVSR